jgi:AraC family transcriptional regulator, regulatory protein of adaptative response / methylated-DNA-[protein]-cysteine methyltransferase
MKIRYALGPSSLGYAFAGQSERGLCCLYFLDADDAGPGLARLRHDFPDAELVADPEALEPALAQIRAVIAGEAGAETVSLDLHGTAFQRSVWKALCAIPRGQTRTYGQIATALGQPGAARAVGAACGANPVALLVPCHRALRAGGGLGGFRWGLEKKQMLLALEKAGAEQLTFAGL